MFANFVESIGSNKVEFYSAASDLKYDEEYFDVIENIFDCITIADDKQRFADRMLL